MLTAEEQREDQEVFGPINRKIGRLGVFFNIAAAIDSVIGTKLADRVYDAQTNVIRDAIAKLRVDSFMNRNID